MARTIYPDTCSDVQDLAARAVLNGAGSPAMNTFKALAKAAGFIHWSGGYIIHPEVRCGIALAHGWRDLADRIATWNFQAARLAAAAEKLNGGH